MICLFGGTFDPIHVGHVHGALAVCDALALDGIRMILSARPGHRVEPAAPVAHRWRMLELACRDHAQLIPDDTELRRRTPSYTVETLESLRGEVGPEVLVWVLGSDAYADLPSWHRWREVLTLTNLVVLTRPGQNAELAEPMASVHRLHGVTHPPDRPAGQVWYLQRDMVAVSASQIRAALAAGEPAAHLLPARVATYIREHGLYGVIRDR